MKFAIGAIVNDGPGCADRIEVSLVEAPTRESALGTFMFAFVVGNTSMTLKSITVRSESETSPDSEYLESYKKGRRIEAIKLRREKTGEDLREAKMYIDNLYAKWDLEGVKKYENRRD